ncbi:MAG TPA: hypothetical protein DEO65_12760 [Bacillus bacterium]|uniref:hypothetical protein n=1 Tax=Siminovitchia fordii TaxID=254759 RepID=UPI0003A8AE87|nr:hypothetical protein [Siminovitchia fordii]HBZ10732.1 hypothetical protein [Bacillus sp. (in: firmicutes)]
MEGDLLIAAINAPHTFGENKYHLACVSMGNPHVIIFVDEVDAVPLEIEHACIFPDRVNVGIVEIKGHQAIIIGCGKEDQALNRLRYKCLC